MLRSTVVLAAVAASMLIPPGIAEPTAYFASGTGEHTGLIECPGPGAFTLALARLPDGAWQAVLSVDAPEACADDVCTLEGHPATHALGSCASGAVLTARLVAPATLALRHAWGDLGPFLPPLFEFSGEGTFVSV